MRWRGWLTADWLAALGDPESLPADLLAALQESAPNASSSEMGTPAELTPEVRAELIEPLCHYSCVAYILRIVVRFGRHDAFYLWQVWWSAQAGRKGRHELCSSQPHKPPTNHPARPLMQKFFRCAGQIAAPCGARYPSWGEARRKRQQVRTKGT